MERVLQTSQGNFLMFCASLISRNRMRKHGKEATKNHDLLAAAIHMKALPSRYTAAGGGGAGAGERMASLYLLGRKDRFSCQCRIMMGNSSLQHCSVLCRTGQRLALTLCPGEEKAFCMCSDASATALHGDIPRQRPGAESILDPQGLSFYFSREFKRFLCLLSVASAFPSWFTMF